MFLAFCWLDVVMDSLCFIWNMCEFAMLTINIYASPVGIAVVGSLVVGNAVVVVGTSDGDVVGSFVVTLKKRESMK